MINYEQLVGFLQEFYDDEDDSDTKGEKLIDEMTRLGAVNKLAYLYTVLDEALQPDDDGWDEEDEDEFEEIEEFDEE